MVTQAVFGTGRRLRIQVAAALTGVVFLIVTVAGFIPGVTTEYGRLDTFGAPGAKLLGIFGVNWVENLVHLAYGVGGLLLARTARWAWRYFVGGGALYLLVGLYGFATGTHSEANLLGVNAAGNWLHVALSVGMVGVGLLLGGRNRPAARA
jgi:hypothetical protein